MFFATVQDALDLAPGADIFAATMTASTCVRMSLMLAPAAISSGLTWDDLARSGKPNRRAATARGIPMTANKASGSRSSGQTVQRSSCSCCLPERRHRLRRSPCSIEARRRDKITGHPAVIAPGGRAAGMGALAAFEAAGRDRPAAVAAAHAETLNAQLVKNRNRGARQSRPN